MLSEGETDCCIRKVVDYSLELFENSFANYTEAIRQSFIQTEISDINERLERLIPVLNLYHSLREVVSKR
ncbi:MAG TPA: hypothetical protein VK102_04400 [Sphingobacterium sp.]|nr:hypothetical protein [Sphingobacterium sp.]